MTKSYALRILEHNDLKQVPASRGDEEVGWLDLWMRGSRTKGGLIVTAFTVEVSMLECLFLVVVNSSCRKSASSFSDNLQACAWICVNVKLERENETADPKMLGTLIRGHYRLFPSKTSSAQELIHIFNEDG